MRQLLHTRETRFRGYRRDDGLWDIEAELLDTKEKPLHIVGERTIQPGESLHDLRIQVTVDSQYTVQSIQAEMQAVPHVTCPAALPPMQGLVGCKLSNGWRQSVNQHLGTSIGCTHLRDMLVHMATVAFQTLSVERPHESDIPPPHLGQCVTWDFSGAAVRRTYPVFAR